MEKPYKQVGSFDTLRRAGGGVSQPALVKDATGLYERFLIRVLNTEHPTEVDKSEVLSLEDHINRYPKGGDLPETLRDKELIAKIRRKFSW